jgi:hypothetical protein
MEISRKKASITIRLVLPTIHPNKLLASTLEWESAEAPHMSVATR